MKRILLHGMMLILLPLCTMAQGEELTIIKGDCLPDISGSTTDSHRATRRLPSIKTEWDADKTYKQLVILFSFSDNDFLEDHTLDFYNRIFNESGYNEGHGAGCVTDYFRTQSGGLFNLEFDVYGPYKVSTKACPIENPTSKTRYYGADAMSEATTLFLEDHPEIDFSQYDWNDDGQVDQVVYVYAGFGGNYKTTYGYLWPNTSSFTALKTPDGKKISRYSASAEIWPTSTPISCGIGTICHEFSHCFGLPDIYPVGSTSYPYTSVDEWDLMDGGNFTNWGWCPPSYSPLEKMLLGWLTPIELTEAVTITDMKPVSEGGPVYQIKHTDNEYLLLENRQWKEWDAGIPGQGLVIYYVNYQDNAWRNNRVNSFSSESSFRYKLVHADNKEFSAWEEELGTKNKYIINSERMNKLHLSTSSYPFGENCELTNSSVPASQMNTENTAGEKLLSKPITNIHMTDDGVVSFEFNEVTKLLVEGEESKDGGSVSKSIVATEGKKTLTVEPNKGFYVEAKDIRIVRNISGTTEPVEEVEVTAVDASADPSEITKYTYPYEEGYGYQITVDFHHCTDFEKPENYPVITLETTTYEYDGMEKEPEVTSVTYGDDVLVAPSNYKVTYEDNINVGEGKVIITGTRCFIGSATITFMIVEPSGINTVRKDGSNENVYDLQGRRVSKPQSGQVYIMKESNGKTHKQIYRNAK